MRMLRKAMLGIAAVAVLAGAKPAPRDVPVRMGGSPDMDACPSNAHVTGLNPRGDNFLSVRSRPAVTGRELDRLPGDYAVWACDETHDGEWTGIVYSRRGQHVDCGVGTPMARRQAYAGPCATGWVASRYLTIVAG
jgi:hypothetical protein